MSACLKARGHAIHVIFARAVTGRPLPQPVMDAIAERCVGNGLVGLSLMSNHFPHAVTLTRRLKERGIGPVIWGGVYPTFCPEDSLQHADMVCVGEGEAAIVALAEALASAEGAGGGCSIGPMGRIGPMVPGVRHRGPPAPPGPGALTENLDALPLPDFGPEGHAVRDGSQVLDMTPALFEKFLTKRETSTGEYVAEYYVATSRGCPYRCAYCASHTLKALYPGQRFFRLRDPERVVAEVEVLRARFPFVRWIYFSDDDLFASPPERLARFCELWRARIGLPFYATTTPWSYDEAKARRLRDAGMEILNIGIQAVSAHGSRLYRRPVTRAMLEQVTASAARLGLRLPPLYDFILDNPYESTADRLESLDFVLTLPRPVRLQLFSLVPFPGTEIHRRMKADGLLPDEDKAIYSKSYSYPAADYLNMLMFLAGAGFPRTLLKALRARPFLWLFHNRLARRAFHAVPYGLFVSAVRRVFNWRFWRSNLAPKGDD
jgi:radical SAM superfamily enzyme YgiQ (UPF0313 family)